MTSLFHPWLRFWSLKMEGSGFPLEELSSWIPNIWAPNLAFPLKTWVVEEGRGMEKNRISSHRFFSSIFKTLDIHTVKYVPKSLFESLKFLGMFAEVREPNQTVFLESRAWMSYFPRRPRGQHVGPIQSMGAWSCPSSQVFLLILPTLLRSQGQAGLFKLAPEPLTLQGSPSVPLLCRCQKDLRLFS